jgi:hypothetical protein
MDPGHLQTNPGRCADLEIHLLWRSVPSLGAYTHGCRRAKDLDPVATLDGRLYPDRIPIPRADGDLATVGVDIESLAAPDVDGRVDLLGGSEGQSTGDERE